ncbi:hypothetical protein L228DRAFT_225794 [Xylona heveae TC161]|uniref:Histone deacetylase interacting domain-containing protein n=1 Tax=Xylona heveae (strain CBS 132557 / TC161) TaxID=1328760 RepID=A0A165JDM5_XYLHT|nr:hypothetical protein L228DRAFT_225794 [Xylona heveae TC161]KZF26100.1 hypothetical protein L228DRAFT_225794 [Xylona heveae TC161]
MSSSKDSWPPSAGAGSTGAPQHTDGGQHQHQRPLGGFGSSSSGQQNSPGQPGVPVLPPPSASFFSPTQPNPHSLPTIAGLTQPPSVSPSQGPSHTQQPQPQQPPPQPLGGAPHHPAQQGPGYSLPAIGQAVQAPPSTQTSIDREREMRDRELRERDARERQRQQEEAAMRERDMREREHRERQQREQHVPQPHQNHAGSIPIHQPVASKVPTVIHGPNGILSNLGSSAGPTHPSSHLGGPSSHGSVFGGPPPSQMGEGASRSIMQHPGQGPQPNQPQQQPPQAQGQPQPQMMGIGSAQGPHQMPGGVAGLPQGQQPILNDALSYLDQVKVQFVDQPDVYNRFLDIMKDFKSQAIDTPGVIDRVSTLFAGHPNLIQGFNTFLPPGYRIECGTGDDPNAIRVTTPMGTTVSSMTAGLRPPSIPPSGSLGPGAGPHVARQAYYDQVPRSASTAWGQGPHGAGAPPGIFDPRGPEPVSAYGLVGGLSHGGQPESQTQREQQMIAGPSAGMSHQQEPRAITQLQNAAAAVPGGAGPRQAVMQVSPNGVSGTPLPSSVAGVNGMSPAGQSGLPGSEKRGPVEFNHAISYVNKIKNRFASQPEIYKQFLEILQTYQRESKPIQDVYAQVTHLFNSAPDLLEDFKQFLPESAAQAKAQAAAKQAAEDAAILSNVRNDPSYLAGAHSLPGQQTPGAQRVEARMPPVGNFAPPPSVGKENKKRRAPVGGQVAGISTGGAAPSQPAELVAGGANLAAKFGSVQAGSLSKRAKTHHKPSQPEAPAVSPTLTPALPEPLPPTSSSAASTEEIAFFDRVKKFIGNKQTMNEFLKLCNLFSQDLIAKNVLVHKVSSFIGGNPELMTWFKRFVRYEGGDEVIENKPRPESERVTLSNCRGLGPSYRLLPKRERLRPCSGRDELCWQVLNDEWASHPTWASEDSGFVAHRKNIFEEGLHRIEEERHDYDFNIETCLRTIQLLEPIAQQIALMSEEERKTFTLPKGLGGQSETIPQRVIKKIYNRERGQQVIDDMFLRPCAVVPIVLFRLKQKAEEWKASQREWDKVWREQTQKMYWRSLDHQGIHAKQADKKRFQTKTLREEIYTKLEEQKRQRLIPWSTVPKYQFAYTFEDTEVILDAVHLLLTHLEYAHPGNVSDHQKLKNVIEDFIPAFFSLDPEKFQQHMKDTYLNGSPANEDMEDETPGSEEAPSSRSRRGQNASKSDLLRGVLQRGRNSKSSRKEKEGSAMSGSKESTPDISSAVEDEISRPVENGTGSVTPTETTVEKWIEHPVSGNIRSKRNVPPNGPYKRDTYNLYCNLNVYCFFRMFQVLYERLSQIKQYEDNVHEDIRRAMLPKPARDLKAIDKLPSDFFEDISPSANYYHQVRRMCEEVVKGEMDMSHLEDALRRYYRPVGWQLYTLEKLLSTLTRFALAILISDAKDRSNDIINLFLKDREKEETTHQTELNYRKQVEKLTKDGDIFRITYNAPTTKTTVQVFKKDDTTFDTDELTAEAKWSYYISSYTMVEPTEGIPLEKLRMPFLKRNLPPQSDSDTELAARYTPQETNENLVIRVCVNSYKILYEPNTTEWWYHAPKSVSENAEVSQQAERIKEKRNSRFQEKFIMNNEWMKGLSRDEVDRKNEDFNTWIRDGVTASQKDGSGPVKDDDEAMADV